MDKPSGKAERDSPAGYKKKIKYAREEAGVSERKERKLLTKKD